MATPTMESIKKKMQAMKQEKENVTDLADQAEEKTKLAQQKLFKVNQITHSLSKTMKINFFKLIQTKNFKAEEENAELMKRITQLENDMNKVQADLTISSEKLEKANKKNSDVSCRICFLDLSLI